MKIYPQFHTQLSVTVKEIWPSWWMEEIRREKLYDFVEKDNETVHHKEEDASKKCRKTKVITIKDR